MYRPAVRLLLIIALVTPTLAFSGATLTLRDGQVLKGADLQRKGNFYILELETGGFITMPVEIVKKFALTVEGVPDGEPAKENQATSSAVVKYPPDSSTAASGTNPEAGPDTTADEANDAIPPTLPKRNEQLQAFGKPPSRFRNSLVDPSWAPSSDWDLDPAGNNFNPSRWFTPSIDPNWHPDPSFDRTVDVFKGGHVRWKHSIIDPTWTPTPGFTDKESSGFTYDDETIPLVESGQYEPQVKFE